MSPIIFAFILSILVMLDIPHTLFGWYEEYLTMVWKTMEPLDYRINEINGSSVNNELYHDIGWWNRNGWAKGLHIINDVRVEYYGREIEKSHRRFEHISGTPIGMDDSTYHQFVVADIGCGGGILMEGLQNHSYVKHIKRKIKFVGVDISRHSIKEAVIHANEHHHYHIDYKVASAYSLPFRNESIDVIMLSDILDHLDDLPRAMNEVSRVLKDHGKIVFGTITRRVWSYLNICNLAEWFGLIPLGTHDYRLFITPDEMSTLFNAIQFKPNEFIPMDVSWKFDWNGMVAFRNMIRFNKATLKKASCPVKGLYLGYAHKK